MVSEHHASNAQASTERKISAKCFIGLQRGQVGWSAVYYDDERTFKSHIGQVVCPSGKVFFNKIPTWSQY